MSASSPAWPLPTAALPRRSGLPHADGIELPWAIRAALLLFIFLIPLETVGHDSDTTSFTVARLAGMFLVAASLLRPRLLLRLPDRLTLWGFGLMTVALLRTACVDEEQLGYAAGRYVTWLQMLVFFHLARPMLAAPALRLQALYVYVAGACATALMMLRGSGLNAGMMDKGRAAVGNLDPNVQAAVLGLAAVWLLAALLHERFSLRNPRLLLGAPAFLLLVSAGLLTGSRGGALSLIVALLAVLCSAGGGRRALRTFLIVSAGLVLLVIMAMQNEDLMSRLQQSVEQGDTAGRGYLYASSLDMWIRKPFLGWGLGANEVELGGYTDTAVRDMHSIYLYALTAGGAAGGLLLGGLLINSVRSARRLAPGLFRQVAVTGLVFVLVFGGTVTILFFKFFWVALVMATPMPGPARAVAPPPAFRPA